MNFAFINTVTENKSLFNLISGEATVKLAKFCSLRPVHVKLCGEKYSFLKKQSQNLNIDQEYNNSQANVMESLLHVELAEKDDEVQPTHWSQHQVKNEPNCNIDRVYNNSNAKKGPPQLDYAENLASESQNGVLPALWNQHQVSNIIN